MDDASILIRAIMQKDSARLRSHLEQGISPNCYEDKAHLTPLHYAVMYDSLECAQILIAAGANPLAKDVEDETPWGLAQQFGNAAMIKLFKGILKCGEEEGGIYS
jgi:ankyrin repeat protein